MGDVNRARKYMRACCVLVASPPFAHCTLLQPLSTHSPLTTPHRRIHRQASDSPAESSTGFRRGSLHALASKSLAWPCECAPGFEHTTRRIDAGSVHPPLRSSSSLVLLTTFPHWYPAENLKRLVDENSTT